MDLRKDIMGFLVDEECITTGQSLAPDASLLENGIIDSVVIASMITFLESRYGFTVEDEELMPENFDSLEAIEQYVQSKRSSN